MAGGTAKVRVLIVSQYFFPENFRVNDVAKGLLERGHDVTVLTGQPNYETGSFFEGYSAFRPRRQVLDGVEVVRCPLVPRGPGTGARLALNYASFAMSSAFLAPLRLRKPFDVGVVYQMSPVTMAVPAFVLKRLWGLPVVFWIQDLWPETLRATGKVRSERVLANLRRMVASMYRASDRVLVESEAFLPAVLEAGLDQDRVAYLPEWAESFYRPVEVEEDAPERAETRGQFRVVFGGNIGVAQAIDTIIDAADHLRDHPSVRWVMIGDGRRREWAQRRVAELDLQDRFLFLGRRPPEAMPRYFALADILLLTLRRDPAFAMTIPAKLQSYLACGRPIAAAIDGEGARVVRASGAGLTCPAEDSEGLADAVSSLLHMSPPGRAAMGRTGRMFYEAHFERESLLDQLESHLAVAAAAASRRGSV